MVEITKHGYQSAKKRSTASGNQVLERAEKAYYFGKDISDFDNKEMRKYLANVLERSSGDTLKVLGNEIYLFGGQTLITILKLKDAIMRKNSRVKVYIKEDDNDEN